MRASFKKDLEYYIQAINKNILDIENGRFEYTYTIPKEKWNLIILTLHDKLLNETEDKYVNFSVLNGIDPYNNNKKCKYFCNKIVEATNNMIVDRRNL